MLREDGTLAATTNSGAASQVTVNAASRAKDYVRRHWKYKEPAASVTNTCRKPESGCNTGLDMFFERIQSHTLCISGMAFQDAWNIDLERLQRCCVHVATSRGQLVPFCAYYMTDSSGRRLPDLQNHSDLDPGSNPKEASAKPLPAKAGRFLYD